MIQISLGLVIMPEYPSGTVRSKVDPSIRFEPPTTNKIRKIGVGPVVVGSREFAIVVLREQVPKVPPTEIAYSEFVESFWAADSKVFVHGPVFSCAVGKVHAQLHGRFFGEPVDQAKACDEVFVTVSESSHVLFPSLLRELEAALPVVSKHLQPPSPFKVVVAQRFRAVVEDPVNSGLFCSADDQRIATVRQYGFVQAKVFRVELCLDFLF